VFIHPNVMLHSGMISNCFILNEGDGLTLIDCGVSRDFKKILASLTKLGYPEKPVKQILITHADGDHYGSAAKLKETCKTRLYSNQVEKEAIEIGGSSRPLKGNRLKLFIAGLLKPLFAVTAINVDECVSEATVLPVLNGLRVLNTPGHTPGHTSFWLKEEKILFAGDSIWEVSGKPSPSTGMNCWDENLAKESFEAQMRLKPRVICAGHSCIFIK